MYKSEKKSVINVLVLYLSSTLLLFATLFTSYYFYQKEEFLQAQKNDLKKDAVRLNDELISLHKGAYNRYKYPRFKKFESAIYDIDKELIFSTFQEKIEAFDKEFFIKGDFSYYVFELHPYYLGAAYAVIKKQNNEFSILNKLLIIALLTLIVILTTAYFLARLVLKPLRENIQLLDHFIKDTTHELNTPITTILTNIESIKIEDEKALKKLSRIQTAAMNISNLYEDLVYLVFNHKVSTHNETLDLSEIVQERIEYFSSTAQSKQIHFLSNIANNVTLFADKQKIKKLIDNILSNGHL